MTKKEMLKNLWKEIRVSYKEWKKYEALTYWSKWKHEMFDKQVYAYVIVKKVRY
jgi:hypothetical protein